jgi:hypothetical protein
MLKAIGSWVCNSAWTFFKDKKFQLEIPTLYRQIVKIDAVEVCPKLGTIKITGTFIELK